MEPTGSAKSISEDVLHFENQTKLTPEEIAKAVAHHNRHHGDKPQEVDPQKGAGKQDTGRKSK